MCKVKDSCLVAVSVILCIFTVILLLALVEISSRKKFVVEEPPALKCYVCETRKNLPGVGNTTAAATSMEEDECLNNPTQEQQCAPGQFCAVLHQKLGSVERVIRSCYFGGKLGCETNIVYGIKEKACFCDKSLCIQKPFFYEHD